ncbi:MAG: NAD(P)-binding domain-containing protein [Marinifilaceae bacterium]|jgi:pyrroline-5-carboxylate reductase|nr:NAD(P)-binding domain-containing protein [Marinifilaceae bacterium]
MKITIIGTGNIGGAIAMGLANSSMIATSDITCVDILPKNLENIIAKNPEINTTSNAIEGIQEADIILLALKPWIIGGSINQIKEHINPFKQMVVSVAAGISFEEIREYFKINDSNEKTPPLFRLIPNTAIEVKSSLTLIASYNASKEQESLLLDIFNELGEAILVPEKLLSAGTSVASCGIAFALRYIRASTVGSVELGFSPEQAQSIVMQTLKGAVEILKSHGTNPEQEIDKVTTPGGVTIKGLNKMEENGFTNAVIKGLLAASK